MLIALASLAACMQQEQRAPAGFSPAHKIVEIGERVARCNTVHSLALPQAVITRYQLKADLETGVLSCSLQRPNGKLPVNIPALISGTATTLTAKTQPIDFEKVLEGEAVTYVAAFPLAERSRIDFSIWMYDPISGERYHLEFQQRALPGRRAPATDPPG